MVRMEIGVCKENEVQILIQVCRVTCKGLMYVDEVQKHTGKENSTGVRGSNHCSVYTR